MATLIEMAERLGLMDPAGRTDHGLAVLGEVRRVASNGNSGSVAPRAAVAVPVNQPCLSMYLAGAIRDGRIDDILWRERVIAELGHLVTIINPLAGKVYDPVTKKWTMSGIASSATQIVKQDFWSVDRVDIVLFNFTALSEGYPNIGTLVEFGRATGTGALLYSVIDRDYTGHANLTMYKLHPFLEMNSAAVFNSLDDAIAFLRSHLKMLNGTDPHYKGVI